VGPFLVFIIVVKILGGGGHVQRAWLSLRIGNDPLQLEDKLTHTLLNLTGIENNAEVGPKLAKRFTKFCLDENQNLSEKFMFRNVHNTDNPKPLNCHLMDKDCVVILKRMYGGEDGSNKQELMEFGDLLTNFFGCEEKDKDVLEAMDDYY
jgi:hypothetical protein